MALQRLLNFDIPAVVGGQKVSTDQQQDNVSFAERGVDIARPIRTWHNFAIMPARDNPLPFQMFEMCAELLPQGFILMGVRKEDLYSVACHTLMLRKFTDRIPSL